MQREQIFFVSQMFMQYWMYASPTKGLRLSQSHDRSHDDRAISVDAQQQWFPKQQLILDDLQEIRIEVNYELGWIHHTIDKHWRLMELHRQKLNYVHRSTVVELSHVESCKK